MALVTRGDVDGMSFGFRVLPGGDSFEMRDGLPLRIIHDMVIAEVSVVTFPAYSAADVQVAQRALQAVQARRGKRIDWLRNLRLRRSGRPARTRGTSTTSGTRFGTATTWIMLIGRHAVDFADAKDEARRAIVAKLDGRDPKGHPAGGRSDAGAAARRVPARATAEGSASRSAASSSEDGRRAGAAFGEWRISEITTDAVKRFRRARPRIAGNRDLGLLRAAFNWAIAGGLLKRVAVPRRERAGDSAGARRGALAPSPARRSTNGS